MSSFRIKDFKIAIKNVITKKEKELNNAMNQLYLSDIKGTLQQHNTKFFSSTHEILSRSDQMLAIKQASLSLKELKS